MSTVAKSPPTTPPFGLGHVCEEELSIKEICGEAAHAAPKKASSSPSIFTSSFAVFQDVGFIGGLGRGEKGQWQGDHRQLAFDEVIMYVFTFSPALLRGLQ